MSIKLSFSVSWQEYYAAQRFLQRRHYGLATAKYHGGALIILGALIWYAHGYSIVPLGAAIAGLGLLFGLPLLRRFELKRRWAREPIYHAEHLVSCTEQGIAYTMGRVASQIGWGYYTQLLESSEGFLLISGQDVFNLIPKRAFPNEQVMDEFRRLATAKLAS